MAGRCTGPGLYTDVTGKVALYGPNLVPWPWPGSCEVDSEANGLHIDTISEKLWVAKSRAIKWEQKRTGIPNGVPTFAGVVSLCTPYDLTVTIPDCSRALVLVELSAGYIYQRMGGGNWWAVQSRTVVYRNNVSIEDTGSRVIRADENPAGAAGPSGSGAPCDTTKRWVTAGGGDTIRVTTNYDHNRIAFAASAANAIEFRAPFLYITAFAADDVQANV